MNSSTNEDYWLILNESSILGMFVIHYLSTNAQQRQEDTDEREEDPSSMFALGVFFFFSFVSLVKVNTPSFFISHQFSIQQKKIIFEAPLCNIVSS